MSGALWYCDFRIIISSMEYTEELIFKRNVV